MFWPFKSRTPAEPCFQIGQYKIDTRIDLRSGFEPLSNEELALLNPDISFMRAGAKLGHSAPRERRSAAE